MALPDRTGKVKNLSLRSEEQNVGWRGGASGKSQRKKVLTK